MRMRLVGILPLPFSPFSSFRLTLTVSRNEADVSRLEGKVATAEDAARLDSNPPLAQLNSLMQDLKDVGKGESVVYWMRMEDMRCEPVMLSITIQLIKPTRIVEDNTAFARAGKKARELGVPLLVLFVLSPGDYKIHDRSTRKIDFTLRNLRYLKVITSILPALTDTLILRQAKLREMNIPLHIQSFEKRLGIPRKLINDVFPDLKANHVYLNMEYEVDELRRDIATVKYGKEKGIQVVCLHDRLVLPPGKVLSQKGKPISIFR
jgi:deoxyribodipyrimidine photo-lyase